VATQGDIAGATAEAQKAVFAEPDSADARRTLATLVLQTHGPAAARAVLAARDGDMDAQRRALGLRAVAEADIGGAGAHAMAQRAIMLAPWERHNWEVLAYVRSKACGDAE
jgi:superkiller protein 3